jgi:hypothetical protein
MDTKPVCDSMRVLFIRRIFMNIIRKVSIVTLSLILLTGCGSSINNIHDDNKLTVGMECNYAPFNWSTTTADEYTEQISTVDYCDGYDVTIAKRLAKSLGMEVEIVKYDWDNLIPGLMQNEIDVVIAGMTATEDRKEVVDFTDPYYTSQEVVIVRKDSTLTSITDIQELKGKTVKGQLNTLYDTIIDQINGVKHGTAMESYPSLVNDLLNKGCDAITAELPVAEGIVASNPDLTYVTFKEGHGFTADTSVSIAVKKDNTELLDKLQKALNAISEEERQQMMLEAVERQPAVNE